MGICCAQSNQGGVKKASEEVYEDILDKGGVNVNERNTKPIELNNHNRDYEVYLEQSKLLLSSNPKINVKLCHKQVANLE